MAEGRSNAAVAGRLVASEKAISKRTDTIFMKPDLVFTEEDNRRVTAVLSCLNS